MGNVVSQDYSLSVSPRECLRNVTRSVCGGSIVVFHDSAKAFRNTEYALPRSIEHILAAGLRFGTIGAAEEPAGASLCDEESPKACAGATGMPLAEAGGFSGHV